MAEERRGREAATALNDLIWRGGLAVTIGSVLLWPIHQLLGGETLTGSLLVAVVGLLTWSAAARLLLRDSAVRRLWILLFAVSALVLILFGRDEAGRHIAIALATLFLLLRRYAAYRHLPGGRRALFFLLGFPVVVILGFGLDVPATFDPQASGWIHALAFNVGRYAIVSLRIFWVLSLVHIFFRMRLHSWRLKPKLAISALLIAIVPLTLVVSFALLALVGATGGSRAMRGSAILSDWSRMAASGTQFAPSHFDTSFTYRNAAGDALISGTPPQQLEALLVRLLPSADSVLTMDRSAEVELPTWSPADTTAYFTLGSELWLLRLAGLPTGNLEIDGYRLSRRPLDRLAGMLGCNVGLYSSARLRLSVAGDELIVADTSGVRTPSISLEGHVTRSAAGPGPPGRRLPIGAALLEGFHLFPDRLAPRPFILHLESSPGELISEFTEGENPLGHAVVWVLAIVAIFFLILEAFALFLGVRIAGGITAAVATLRRGTLRLAAGDLRTRIALPNQDEFGQLADSFNEMTVAVRHGREQAVARERLERELETARKIQERLLPRGLPAVPGFEITGTSVPSRQVGGDYFDVLSLEDGRLGIAIGDVSGKGMPAALLMSNLQASLQGQVIHPSSVAEIVTRMNNLLAHSTDPHMFATFFYGVLDPRDATFTAVNAGHNPPVVRRAGGGIETLDAGGLVLGMLPRQKYKQQTITLAPGDLVVLYTDGITEATSATPAGGRDAADGAREELGDDEDPDRMFGEEQLHELIGASADRSAVEVKQQILEAVERHAAGAPQADDITLVVLKRQAE